MVASSKSKEIHIIRVYDAPVQAVWDAWTDPQQVAQWWGPRGFSITTISKDLKPGGTWKYTMHGPDGTDYPNFTTYHEVVKHKKLVYDHGASGEGAKPMFRVTVLFSEVRGKTKMEMTMALETLEAAENTREIIKKHNGNSTWDRLAEYLAEHEAQQVKFVINRSLDAPIATLFDMYVDPKHIARWLPPAGFTMEYIEADIREGGKSFYRMSGHGMTMYGRAEYLEIRPPDRIVHLQSFVDEKGNLARHPMMPQFPSTMRTEIDFAAEAPDRTRLTVTWTPHTGTPPDEIVAFGQARAGMTQGFSGSFDKLEALLAAQ
ncbi:MAG: SRPBCC family protein [Planctomycetota bacterium]